VLSASPQEGHREWLAFGYGFLDILDAPADPVFPCRSGHALPLGRIRHSFGCALPLPFPGFLCCPARRVGWHHELGRAALFGLRA
jgi:hypothetical protein